MPETIQEKLIQAILGADRELAMNILNTECSNRGAERTISDVLIPVMNEIGELWDKTETISLAQGYVAGKIAGDFMMKAISESELNEGPCAPTKGPVIIGNVEDDHHSLGRKMVSVFLKCKGWEVYDLGNDVLAEDFIKKAVETKAKIIGVSAMMYSTAVNIKKLRKKIDDSPELSGKIKLAVGGAVFTLRPELVQEVGGDGTANNAFLVPELFDTLMKAIETEAQK